MAALAPHTVMCRCRCQAELQSPPVRRVRQAGSLHCRRHASSLAAKLEATALEASGQGMPGHPLAAWPWQQALQLTSQAALMSQARAVLQA